MNNGFSMAKFFKSDAVKGIWKDISKERGMTLREILAKHPKGCKVTTIESCDGSYFDFIAVDFSNTKAILKYHDTTKIIWIHLDNHDWEVYRESKMVKHWPCLFKFDSGTPQISGNVFPDEGSARIHYGRAFISLLTHHPCVEIEI